MNTNIRNDFPYPIAKVYLRAMNAEEPVEKFTILGYLFEIALKYAASISISEYLNFQDKDSTINKILSGISRPSLGKWAEFLRETLKFNLAQNHSVLSEDYFKKKPDYKKMVIAVNTINEQLNPQKANAISTISPESFVNTVIQFRNKTKGHGAIQKADCQRINDILFEGLEEFILSFKEFVDFPPAFISKIEYDKHNVFNFSLLKLSGTDLIRTSYSTSTMNNSLRSGSVCICQNTNEGLQPIINLHPLFILIEDREEVYVLNESESAKMEYLCYHRGGKDAIYSPDELKEDFAQRFGEIFNQDNSKIKPKIETEKKAESYTDKRDKKKGVPLIPILGALFFLIVVLVAVYLIFFNKPADTNTAQIQSTGSDTTLSVKKPDTVIRENNTSITSNKSPEISEQQNNKKEKNEKDINNAQAAPTTYFEDVDIKAAPSANAEDFLDYTGLKMSPEFKGNVRIKAFINESGIVDKTETLGSGIDQRFNSAAENAVKKIKFSPAIKNGNRVKSISIITVLFQGAKK
jgi:hypothetical protein